MAKLRYEIATTEYVDDLVATKLDEAELPNAINDALAQAKNYTDTAISNIPEVDLNGYATETYVNTAVSTHNTSNSAHNDIRLLISDLTTKVNNFLDVDDTTTDQLSELIALIQANANDIESITSGKVNVTDIINNLTTNSSNKVLSAAQGVVLKGLIDALDTNKLNTSELTSAINTALNTAKESGEFDGEDGEDGYTPVRGTDYWTEADKAEIKSYVDQAILGGAW